jgi:hypothetical protein
VVACEGTGHMAPLMLSDMYYSQEAAPRDSNGRPAPVPSREERDIVRNQELDCRATEAVLRNLSAGCGQAVCVRAPRPQEMTRHDPRVRPGPFYRLAAEIFPIDFEDLVRNALGYESDCSWCLHPPEAPTRSRRIAGVQLQEAQGGLPQQKERGRSLGVRIVWGGPPPHHREEGGRGLPAKPAGHPPFRRPWCVPS